MRAGPVAVSPVAAQPEKTLFHELAHVVLGHTVEAELTDDERTPRTIRELQAKADGPALSSLTNNSSSPRSPTVAGSLRTAGTLWNVRSAYATAVRLGTVQAL